MESGATAEFWYDAFVILGYYRTRGTHLQQAQRAALHSSAALRGLQASAAAHRPPSRNWYLSVYLNFPAHAYITRAPTVYVILMDRGCVADECVAGTMPESNRRNCAEYQEEKYATHGGQ